MTPKPLTTSLPADGPAGSHLSAIFDNAGARHRAELVRMLLRM
jgi:hypothetical protein